MIRSNGTTQSLRQMRHRMQRTSVIVAAGMLALILSLAAITAIHSPPAHATQALADGIGGMEVCASSAAFSASGHDGGLWNAGAGSLGIDWPATPMPADPPAAPAKSTGSDGVLVTESSPEAPARIPPLRAAFGVQSGNPYHWHMDDIPMCPRVNSGTAISR